MIVVTIIGNVKIIKDGTSEESAVRSQLYEQFVGGGYGGEERDMRIIRNLIQDYGEDAMKPNLRMIHPYYLGLLKKERPDLFKKPNTK